MAGGEIYRSGFLYVSRDDVRLLIAIQIGDRLISDQDAEEDRFETPLQQLQFDQRHAVFPLCC